MGRIDQDINEDGRIFIDELLSQVGTLKVDQVISSPLKRALTTAILVSGKNNSDVVVNSLCIERDYGKLQGVDPNHVRSVTPKTFYLKVGGIEHSLNPPGGETLEKVRQRAEDFFDDLFDLPDTLLVVSHYCFLMQMHGMIRNQDVYHALATDIGILELNRFEFDGRRLAKQKKIFSINESVYGSW